MPLLEILGEYGEFRELVSALERGVTPVNIVSGVEAQKAHLIYAACEKLGTSGLVVTSSDMEAQKLWLDLSYFYGEHALYFPSKEYVFYDVDSVSREMTAKRLGVLSQLTAGGEHKVVVASIDALLQYTARPETYRDFTTEISVGGRVDLNALEGRLLQLGYVREELVEGRGQFSVRGGIIDIFPADRGEPLRVELFDDEVDSIRTFDPSTQLSTGKLESARITPCREMIFDEARRQAAISALQAQAKKLAHGGESAESARAQLIADAEKLAERYYFASLDKYVRLIYGEIPTLADFMPEGSVVFVDEPKRVSESAKTARWDRDELVSELMEKGVIAPGNKEFSADYHAMIKRLSQGRLVGMSTLSASCPDYHPKLNLSLSVKSLNSFHGKLEFLVDDLKDWQSRHATVVILAGGSSRAEHLATTLHNMGVECVYVPELDEPPKGKICVAQGSLSKGFAYPMLNFVVVSDREVFTEQKRRKKAGQRSEENKLRSFTDISPGDYVVHQAHGIGRYEGINKLTVDGVTKDYLKISYYGTDSLYVPVDQLDMLYKYIGNTDRQIKLSRLGGTDWNKTKARVKASAADLAKHLMELYAARQQAKGHAFSADTPWQREFEDAFPYEETGDQLRCIEEVKHDMEQTRPMDRLLCGDVGYGKTEVALRAAFKAVADSKQVAYLVPTTILAMQHYNTFSERMREFPIKVEMLSRFRTPAQQKQTLSRLRTGETDIVIGTHRLLQKDLKFKDLGLLIIDEEQRFGVAHKEKLKDLRRDVDVLTLTATPIPRTLHMAMVNIRDMSVIAEPPENRYPVQTYVMEYDEGVILDAIRREIGRGGQVYYLHNRVSGIYTAAQRLAALIPEARLGVGHGKMREEELEDVMLDMVNGEINVLVCTTIIETGLDIPNVNTIIIENADRMGLAQLYQLRGRVGRSNRLAYAYLTYRRDKMLTDVAQKRLTAIREFTEFGSGFKIAMRDLEIRGAGNLLGAEQHGHMDAVGYDMYCQLLRESVEEMQGISEEKKISTTVDIHASAHIPEDFIISQDQRIDIYKKIAAIGSVEDSYDVEEEIEDRFGDLPVPVRNLIDIALLKADAAAVGISEVVQKENGVMLRFEPDSVDMKAVAGIISGKEYKGQMLFSAGARPYLMWKHKPEDGDSELANIKFLLHRMKELHEAG